MGRDTVHLRVVGTRIFYEQLFVENLFIKTTRRTEYFSCKQSIGYCIIVKHCASATYDRPTHLVLFFIDFFSQVVKFYCFHCTKDQTKL